MMQAKRYVSGLTPSPGASRFSLFWDTVFWILLSLTIFIYVWCIYHIFIRTPTELRMGIVQKIFYFHVPSAYAMYLGATACFIGSAVFLIKESPSFDALALAGADVAALFGTIVLVTGMLWAHKAWGAAWTWDPRLTTALLSLLIYVAYLVLRTFSGDSLAERKFAAALGIIGAANLPIIHYSVQKWSGQHPTVITAKGGGLSSPEMKFSLGLAFLAFTLLAILFIWAKARFNLAHARLISLEDDAIDLDIDLDGDLDFSS